jgi:hypothetical protein
MANVFATKNGNWSDTTVWNTGALPTSADDVYANNFTVSINQNVTVLSIRSSSATGIANGGLFTLINGVTVSATGIGFVAGATGFIAANLIDFTLSTPNSATLIGNISLPGGDGAPTVRHNGTGTLNYIGSITSRSQSSTTGILVTSTGTLNVTGNQFSATGASAGVLLRMSGNGVINLTGDLIWQSSTSGTPLVSITSAGTFNMTGTVYGGGGFGIQSTGASLINIIGPIIAGVIVGGTLGFPALNTTNGSSVTILTGPFISHSSGIQPFIVVRMHYRRTIGSYYEFRDNSTNGALPPGASAPATRLVSPDTVADSPIPANVRQGTVYSLGSQTGTMIVPSPSNVANNVPVDNTVGTAVLDPNAIWAVPLTSINTLNSIGRRVKNAATVETTGAQIQTTLNNNE